jgi:hypothetical protein
LKQDLKQDSQHWQSKTAHVTQGHPVAASAGLPSNPANVIVRETQ